MAMGVLQLNSSAESRSGLEFDRRIDSHINEWLAGQTPGEKRILTVLLTDAAHESGLIELVREPRLIGSYLSWLSRTIMDPRGPDYAKIMSEAGLPLVDWQAESLLWAGDKEKRLRSLAASLGKAQQASARILVVAQGQGARIALEALKEASPEVRFEKFLALGTNRLKLSGAPAFVSFSNAPSRIGEIACLWSEGVPQDGRGQGSINLEFQHPGGQWTRLAVNELFLSETGKPLRADAEMFRRIRDILTQDRSLSDALIRAKIIKPSLTGFWSGTYFYPDTDYYKDKKPVNFDARLRQLDNTFEGSIVEPNTFGDNTSSVLKALILNGLVDREGNLRFIKKYEGTAGVVHSIEYKGTLSPDGRNINGIWTLLRKGNVAASGRFEMIQKRDPSGQGRETLHPFEETR